MNWVRVKEQDELGGEEKGGMDRVKKRRTG